jgi:CHASE3 domain sensor protein
MTTKEVPISRNVEIKTPLTLDKKDELLRKISDAYKVIAEKDSEIESHKDFIKDLKEQIDAEVSKVKLVIAVYDKGFESRMVECVAEYKDGRAKFTDVHTGEIVEDREMTEAEQLQLSNGWIDAENIIRADNEESDSED